MNRMTKADAIILATLMISLAVEYIVLPRLLPGTLVLTLIYGLSVLYNYKFQDFFETFLSVEDEDKKIELLSERFKDMSDRQIIQRSAINLVFKIGFGVTWTWIFFTFAAMFLPNKLLALTVAIITNILLVVYLGLLNAYINPEESDEDDETELWITVVSKTIGIAVLTTIAAISMVLYFALIILLTLATSKLLFTHIAIEHIFIINYALAMIIFAAISAYRSTKTVLRLLPR